jgi:hypothetical protein
MAAIDISNAASGGGGGGGNLQLSGGASMTSTLTAVTDTSNVSSPLKLSTTAVQVTSPLRITTSDASGFYLDAEDSATNNRFSIKRDPSSQEVTLDFASNPAGSTTLVGAIRTYRDGTNLSNAMSFIEDGSVGIGTTAPVGLLDLYKAAAATRLAIRGDAGQNRLISYRTGALQRFGLYVNNTAESGSNAGSNFAIRAYDDAGTLLSTPFFINRSTGNVGINTITPSQKLHVVGSLRIESGGIYDGTNSIGTSGQVLSSTGTATAWVTPSGGSPAGTTGAVQFNNAGAFGADSANFFWDDTNNRLGIGTNAPAYPFEVTQSVSGNLFAKLQNTNAAGFGILLYGGSGTSTYTMQFADYNGSGGGRIYPDGIFIGAQSAPTARLQIQGSGSTSATTSLLVQNSAGTSALTVRDDLSVAVNGAFTVANGLAGIDILLCNLFNTRNNAFNALGFNNSTGNANFWQFVSIGSSVGPVASAALDINSTTRGLLPPRMTTAEKNAIATPAAGLMVYDTTLNKLCVRTAAAWETITSI